MQNLINTNLGITEAQLARRHIVNSQQNIIENERVQGLLDQYNNPGSTADDKFFDDVEFLIRNFSSRQIHIWYKDVINEVSTHPIRNQQMIVAAYNQLFNVGPPKPPGEKFFIDDLPDINDAIKRDFEINYFKFRNAWTAQLNIWDKINKSPIPNINQFKNIRDIRARAMSLKQAIDGRNRQIATAKNLTLDLYKKTTNFLVISQNNATIRVFAAQALRELQKIGALAGK